MIKQTKHYLNQTHNVYRIYAGATDTNCCLCCPHSSVKTQMQQGAKNALGLAARNDQFHRLMTELRLEDILESKMYK